jgi:hypothetical protein
MERHSALAVDKLLASEDVIERDCAEFVLYVGEFAGKGGPFEQGNPPAHCMVLGMRPKQAGIAVVGCAAEENLLTVDVGQAELEICFERSAVITRDGPACMA